MTTLKTVHGMRGKDEDLVEGPSQHLLQEAGARLAAIVDAHGPQAVGIFKGTQCGYNSLNNAMVDAFVKALGTHRSFITMTIDQSAKWTQQLRIDFDRLVRFAN